MGFPVSQYSDLSRMIHSLSCPTTAWQFMQMSVDGSVEWRPLYGIV